MGVVLVGQRGAEEGEEAVAQELGHDLLIAVDLGERAGEELSTRAAIASAPIRSAVPVESTMSQKRAVTVLRSPSRALREARMRSAR